MGTVGVCTKGFIQKQGFAKINRKIRKIFQLSSMRQLVCKLNDSIKTLHLSFITYFLRSKKQSFLLNIKCF